MDPARQLATAADLLALPAETHAEVIAGAVIEKANPSAEQRRTARDWRIRPLALSSWTGGVDGLEVGGS